jgi:hypothetical protein
VVQPGADAAKLYTYIMKPKPYYNSWNLMPGAEKLEETKEHHGSFMTCYVNSKALGSMKKKNGMADGSIIVAENYGSDKKLESLTVMYKVKDYNPEAGDWFWVKYDANNGYVMASGKVESCISCHASKKENDYLHTVAAEK